ncbi:hypothetical protein LTR56_004370 [Elasticomyces elasticus]|nr:hypothetical protein LTR22_012098 [Elasticomyces elasticus]KAK3653958.1 hypothetical protein LTR56_004370 [Elasticomyces elasticus]KAK4917155.1 hypothetical protein LTR49_014920 [Elasticomyces elasticus]KAK5757116.1 hypothetical protein LTS12_012790 [Elasticomyces elasticus]
MDTDMEDAGTGMEMVLPFRGRPMEMATETVNNNAAAIKSEPCSANAIMEACDEVSERYDEVTKALDRAFQAYSDAAKGYVKVAAGLGKLCKRYESVRLSRVFFADIDKNPIHTREAEEADKGIMRAAMQVRKTDNKRDEACYKESRVRVRAYNAHKLAAAAHEAAEQHQRRSRGAGSFNEEWCTTEEEDEDEEDEDEESDDEESEDGEDGEDEDEDGDLAM